jgi:fructose-1,6-bisphosphatase/inositol monophosphatase family enzyme
MTDATNTVTLKSWSPDGVVSLKKQDGNPVAETDVTSECSFPKIALNAGPGNGFSGDEVGERPHANACHWIINGTQRPVIGLQTLLLADCPKITT